MDEQISRQKLGEVGVDSGHLIVVDPCYVVDGDGPEYTQMVERTCTDTELAVPMFDGLVFCSGGDGRFPVYGVFKVIRGRPALVRVEIVLDESGEPDAAL